MALKTNCLIYEKVHNCQIYSTNGFSENKYITVIITDFVDYLQIKVKDSNEFTFNYTANIDRRQFSVMKTDQNLDISFGDLKTTILDLLQQNQREDMCIKFEINHNIIDLQMTSQKEIFDEMNSSIVELQQCNRSLNLQVQKMSKLLQDKDLKIGHMHSITRSLEQEFVKDLQLLNNTFNNKFHDCTSVIINKLIKLTTRLMKLTQIVEQIKTDSSIKDDTNKRLVQSLENLRSEKLETSRTIMTLQNQNDDLQAIRSRHERLISELRKTCDEKDCLIAELQSNIENLEKDLGQATGIIAQKTATNDELAKDLLQANQMLVNFNNLYDSKNHEIGDLQKKLAKMDETLTEQNKNFSDVLRQFNDYKREYNLEEFRKLQQELHAASKRIEELEKHNRETVKCNYAKAQVRKAPNKKISGFFPGMGEWKFRSVFVSVNEILTRKLSTGNYGSGRPYS